MGNLLMNAFSIHGGKFEERRRSTMKSLKLNLRSVVFHPLLIFHATIVEECKSLKDLFTFILTFCYINNDFLFIFRKPHNKYKLPLDLTGEQSTRHPRK